MVHGSWSRSDSCWRGVRSSSPSAPSREPGAGAPMSPDALAPGPGALPLVNRGGREGGEGPGRLRGRRRRLRDRRAGFPDARVRQRGGHRRDRDGRTKYTDVAGEPALRDAIAEKYRREQGADCWRENVLVTAGAKQAVFNACQVLFDPGDEVAVFLPVLGLVSGDRAPCGREARVRRDEARGGMEADRRAARSPGGEPRAGRDPEFPEQPHGRGGARREIERILDWCAARDAVLIFDETYDRFLYGASATSRRPRSGRSTRTGSSSRAPPRRRTR